MTELVGKDGLPVVLFETMELWAAWLDLNAGTTGIWVRLAKKNSGVKSIDYFQALEVALCYGWIDGIKKTWDDVSWIQRFTPRKPASKWSKINKEKVLKLIEDGKMKPSGLAVIEISKKKGPWDNAYESQKNTRIPDDLQAELDENPEIAEFFNSLKSVNRYAIIYRLQTSRTPELRAKKLAQFVEMLNKKEKIYN
ncbi:MAG: YdeI family protein [Draconibacterium sp.]